MQLRTQLKEFFVLQTLSTDQRYMEIFKSAEEKLLRESEPSKAKDIKDLVQAYLRRPHASQILSAKAYEWLKHLQMNPPPWFPDQAVELAYGAFRMTGSFEAFVNFLSRPDRRRKLNSIFRGLSFTKFRYLCQRYGSSFLPGDNSLVLTLV